MASKTIVLLLFFVLGFLFVVTPIHAASQTISPGQKIQSCLNQVNPGETCTVQPGTYNEALTLTRSGSQTAPIIVKCTTPKGCTVNSGSNKTVFVSGNASWVTFDGFRLLSTSSNPSILLYYNWVGQAGADSNNNGFTFKNCYIEGEVSIYGAYNLVENCEFNGRGVVATAILERFKPSHDNTYRNNIMHDYTGRGVWAMQRTRNTLVEGNTIYNIGVVGNKALGGVDCDGAWSPDYNCDIINNTIYNVIGGADGGKGIIMENAFEGSEVRGNKISNVNWDGIAVINYGFGSWYTAEAEYRNTNTGMVIENNFISDTGVDGIICHSANGFTVRNNTFKNTNKNRSYFGAIGLVPTDGYACNNWKITGNTFINPIGPALFFEGRPTGIVSDYNTYDISATAKKFVWKSGSDTYYTLAEWRNSRGYDIHSTIGTTPTSPSPSPTAPPSSTPPTGKPGDLNGDGRVNLADYNLLVAGYGTKYTLSDYNQLVANYGT